MKNKKIYYTVNAALIAAAYAALTWISNLWNLAYGPVQFRVSEVLTILPVFTPAAIPGLTLGCFIANIFSFNPIDMVFGASATLIAAFLTYFLRNIRWKGIPLLAMLPPVLVNALIVGLEINFFFLPEGASLWGFLISAVEVGIGELGVCYLLGIPFFLQVKKLRIFGDSAPVFKTGVSVYIKIVILLIFSLLIALIPGRSILPKALSKPAAKPVTKEESVEAQIEMIEEEIPDTIEPEEDQSQSEATKPATSKTDRSTSSEKPRENTSQPVVVKPNTSGEVRAVWISFLEFDSILRGKSEAAFQKTFDSMMKTCAEYGLNTVIVQVRSHADACYNSYYFPSSVHFTVQRQNSFPFDPLQIMVTLAHRYGLKIEAWVNPYRGCKVTDSFAQNDILQRFLNEGKAFAFGDYYYFDPGLEEVRNLIISGVLEIVENYDVDGIHFDDYFYPTADPAIDQNTFAQYGSGQTLSAFRTESVNCLIRALYSEIKSRKNITFGISPAGNIDNCLNKSFADVKKWGKEAGYVDYLAPQLYWDYGPKDNIKNAYPYDNALNDWKKIVTNSQVKLLVGLAPYRVNNETYYPFFTAGDVLYRQVLDARQSDRYGGFIMFRYAQFFSDSLAVERQNLSSLLG